MNKRNIIIAVAVVLIGAGVAFALLSNNDNNSEGSQTSSQSTTDEMSQNTSLKDLLAQNKNMECTFNGSNDLTGEVSGTSYIAGQKVRGDFVITKDSETSTSHLIRNDTHTYVWTDGQQQGAKIENSAEDVEETQQTFDQDENYDFSCKDWTVDESKFNVPGNVNFVDLSAQLDKIKANVENVCDQITNAEAKASCLKAL